MIPNSDEALHPCPHCGGEVTLFGSEATGYFVSCSTRYCYGFNCAKFGYEETRNAWNRRELCRAAPAGGDWRTAPYAATDDAIRKDSGMTLHDRVEYALREAGFDHGEASRIASMSAPAGGDAQKEYEMDKTIYDLAIHCGAYVDGGECPDHSTGFPGSPPTITFTDRQLEAFVAKLREQRIGDTRPLTASDLRDM